MKGLELSEKFYSEYGKKMIEEGFGDIEKYLAAGLIGSGSECFGFDDDISADHDFEPGFCIFIPDESVIDIKQEFALERAYMKLPKEFMGYKRSPLNPAGGNRHGVIRISSFFESKTGSTNGDISPFDYFRIPEQFLFEAVSGKIFTDNYGLLTSIREKISYFPEDVRLKKLAGNLVVLAQTGEYNYERCIKRNDTAAAQLTVNEFVNAGLKAVFLLNKKYIPYYKWTFRAMKELQLLSDLYGDFEYLISSSNEKEKAEEKMQIIKNICERITGEIISQHLTSLTECNTEKQAFSVNDRIKDNNIRNLSIMFAV